VPNSPLSSVLLLNDDVTPMEFVVNLLQDFFGMDYDGAIKLMLRVHHNHPLKCIVAEAR
jgi:ATP-dependent Clp protease adaptor protein ClpS